MATMTPDKYGYRKYLNEKGFKDDEITYDRGNIFVKGQYFDSATPEADGSTYNSRANLDRLYNNYLSQSMVQQQQQRANQYQSNFDQRNNEINELLKSYKDRINKPVQPFSLDRDDIEDSGLYQSQVKLLQDQGQRNLNNSLVSLGRRGIANSKSAVNAAGDIQYNINQDVSERVIPQVTAQLYRQYVDQINRERQETGDILNLANVLNNMSQQDFTNQRSLESDRRAESALTGRYLPSGADNMISEVLDLKRRAEQEGVTSDQLNNYRSRADDLRQQLALMGVDPNIVGYDSDYSTALQNISRGFPTLQQRSQDFNQNMALEEMEYRRARDQIEDERYKQKFDEDVRRFGLQHAMEQARLNNQIRQQNADNARAANNAQLAQLYEVWDRTGVAPAGIPGVEAGTPLFDRTASRQSKSTNLNSVISSLNQKYLATDPRTKQKVVTDPVALERAILEKDLSDEEYAELYAYYGLEIPR